MIGNLKLPWKLDLSTVMYSRARMIGNNLTLGVPDVAPQYVFARAYDREFSPFITTQNIREYVFARAYDREYP